MWSYQNDNPALYTLNLVFTIAHGYKSFFLVCYSMNPPINVAASLTFICLNSCGF